MRRVGKKLRRNIWIKLSNFIFLTNFRSLIQFIKDIDPRWEQILENRKKRAEEKEKMREEAIEQKKLEKKKRRERARKAEQERFAELDKLKNKNNIEEEVIVRYLLLINLG